MRPANHTTQRPRVICHRTAADEVRFQILPRFLPQLGAGGILGRYRKLRVPAFFGSRQATRSSSYRLMLV